MPLDRAEQLRERLLATFRVEAAEHLNVMGAELDALGANLNGAETASRLALLFRTMHTFKGAARSIGLGEVESLCQLCEILLHDLCDGKAGLDARIVHGIQDACDALAALINGAATPERLAEVAATLQRSAAPIDSSSARSVSPPIASAALPDTSDLSQQASIEPHAAPMSAPRSADDARLNSVRVDVDCLDHLSLLAEELSIPKLAAGESARAARAVAEDIARLRASLRRERDKAGSAGARSFEDRLCGIESGARKLAQALRTDNKTLRGVSDQLVDEIRRIRMTPAASALETFPRMVRDLARETKKEVAWQVTGADIEIDRKVLDLVKDPLIHLVRNGIDHGIELPEERLAAGKPRQGTISVKIGQVDGCRIAIEIADDGRGIDPTAIKSAAVRLRALSSDAAAEIGDDEAIDLAFRAGVSTSPVISSISGHGLGLAIVREQVERLEGRLAVHSAPGVGTTIRLDLPAAIATSRGLLVASGTGTLLLPLDCVECAIGVRGDEVSPSLARWAHEFQGRALPFGRLSSIFGFAADGQRRSEEHARVPAIVLRSAERPGIVLIDEVMGEREIVVKELRPPLKRLRNVLAPGLLGTGQLVLMARPSDILQAIGMGSSEEAAARVRAEPRLLRILIVDDSITTRTMERNLFEAAGYEVRTVADGLEALNLLRSESFDLVVSDVDMPRMDGFEFAERVRADTRLAQTPVVLVTALESREDKERGLRVGANAYVLKSAFNQSHLLEIVRRLI